jgi:RNA polymerase sigma-70 factor (ECF subfamily)
MTEPNTRDFGDFNRQLRAYLARRVDAAFVDDIFGEILLRIAEHREQFDRAGNPLAWLYKVAGNLVADHYRRRAVEQSALRLLEREAAGPYGGEADNYRELGQCLRPMIEALPADYRDAVLLTDIQGMPQAEAAARAGLSVSGMKSRVQRGREKLKEALRRCCEIELNRRGQIVDYTQRDGQSPCDKSCE